MGSEGISQRVMRKMRVAQENEDEMYVIIGNTRVENKIAWKRWIDINSTLRGFIQIEIWLKSSVTKIMKKRVLTLFKLNILEFIIIR